MSTKINLNNQSIIVDYGDMVYLLTDNNKYKTIKCGTDLDIHLQTNTQLQYIFAWSNQSQDRNLHISLLGEYSHANIAGYIIANKQVKSHVATIIEHEASYTQGNCFIKGMIDDQAQLGLHGMIKINQTASNSQDQLTEKILVLSQSAVGELKPELEISNHDVKASHATTISHIDENQLWHLQSRGLNQESALKLLINGYVSEIIQIISQFPIPKPILQQIIKKSKVR